MVTLVFTGRSDLKVLWVLTTRVYDLVPFECLGDDNDAWFCPIRFGGI